ncbi:MAG: DUF3656 domain-containing U32 family peptidase [Chitinophagales bacterium]
MTYSVKGRGPELLAPAGEWDALAAAVQSGADAVYLGGKAYSARQFAGNFGPEELARAVTYAHVRGVRIYVTVNTLMKEDEVEGALSYLAELYELGVDAVILQDLGLFRLARETFPAWRLHASTQMTVHHAEAARYLKEQGMDRVVLARELSLAEIARCAAAGVEVEVFVHGALCVCYSGQCLMSSMIGGRSGNRGRCAQPCRLEYTLVDRAGRPIAAAAEAGPHLLSPRDLAALDLLPELAGAGVAALKIEGRMKRPEYVATVVRIYREALDRLREGGHGSGDDRRRELAQAFNRGFTTGYLQGNPGRELMSFQKASNRGVYLGRVAFYDPSRRVATLRLENPLAVGDGLEFWVSQGGRVGVTVSRFWSADRRDGAARPLDAAEPGMKVVIPVEGALRPGDRVFKTSDAGLLTQAAAAYRSPRELLRLPLQARLVVKRGEVSRLTLTDPEGRSVTAQGTVPAMSAERHALEREAVEAQLSRLGNTPFTLAGLDLEAEPGTMLPWSELNALRRSALAALEKVREDAALPPAEEVKAARTRLRAVKEARRAAEARPGSGRAGRLPRLAVALGEVEGLDAVLAAGPDRVILGGERFRPAAEPFWSRQSVARAARLCREAKVEFVLGFPRIIRDHELDEAVALAEACLGLPEAEQPHAFLTGHLALFGELARLLADAGAPLAFHADQPLNVFNSDTALFLAERGAVQVTLSPELTLEELKEVASRTPVATEVLAHGPLELMVTEYCAPGALLGGRTSASACAKVCGGGAFGLRDRLGLVFPLRLDASCRMHLANPKELCLVDQLPALAEVAEVVRLDCRFRDAAYAVQVTQAYRTALALLAESGGRGGEAEALGRLRAALEALAPFGITKGHLYRGAE